MTAGSDWQLYDGRGQRKYLSAEERARFVAALADYPTQTRLFGLTLHYTGCRLSEALNLTAGRVDPSEGVIVLETLKKRRSGIYRAVPVPPLLIAELSDLAVAPDGRLWPWSRATGWRRIKQVMRQAGIEGTPASPKGIRHGYGVAAMTAGIPCPLIQRWMGHARLETTSCYLQAFGQEERALARLMWETDVAS